MSKATDARAHPGLKILTPWEEALVKRMSAQDRERWRDLFSRNQWKPAEPAPKK